MAGFSANTALAAALFAVVSAPAYAEHLPPRSDAEQIRSGLGVARAIARDCPGWRVGPAYENMLSVMQLSATAQKQIFDVEEFLDAAEQEGLDFLKKSEKTLCGVAPLYAKHGILRPAK